jgi:hypothetical protein
MVQEGGANYEATSATSATKISDDEYVSLQPHGPLFHSQAVVLQLSLLVTTASGRPPLPPTPASTTHPPSYTVQTAWDKQFAKMEKWLGKQQWDLPAADSLQKYIDQYRNQNSITGRNLIGLDMKVDTEWVQEYAAR